MKNRIEKGCVFQLKNKANNFVEVVAVADSQAKILVCNEEGCNYSVVNISDLEGIPLSVPILKSLGFECKENMLMGLPYERFWYKCANGFNLIVVEDNDMLKFAHITGESFYGLKFTPVPFLHELQTVIGRVDVGKLFKDVCCNSI